MEELYNSNKDFRTYVDRYCTMYAIPKEEAFKHMLVYVVAKQYKEKEEAKKCQK